jgi:4-amino-4-deoxychorismate lyase
LFETIAVRDGQLRFFGAHYARLVLSCRRLLLPVPEQEALTDYAEKLMGGDRDGTLKIIVTRGSGERGYRLPETVVPTCAMGFSPEPVVASPAEGILVTMCTTRIGSNPVTAGMKTLNRLEQVMARAEWDDPAITEGLMRNLAGDLICGTMSNLFVVLRDQLWTPVLNESGVHGIMRAQVMNLAEELGIRCAERRLTPGVLDEADDVFFTNSRVGVWPVSRMADHHYQRHPRTLQIMRGLAERGVTECAV